MLSSQISWESGLFLYCKSMMMMIKASALASMQQQRHLTSFSFSFFFSFPFSPTAPGAVSALEIIDVFTA